MDTNNIKLNRSQFILKKALKSYFLFGVAFGLIGLIADSFDYFHSKFWFLLVINGMAVMLILISFIGFVFRKIRLRPATAFLVYALIINILITNLYFAIQGFSSHVINLYRGTIIIAIYFSIAAIILKKVHLIILNLLYAAVILFLYYEQSITGLSIESALFLLLIMLTFSYSVSMFMQKMQRTIEINRNLQKEILENQKALLTKENDLIKMKTLHLEEALSRKNRKLLSAYLMLAYDTTEKRKMIKRIEKIKESTDYETEKALLNLLSEISASYTSVHWEEFQKRFEEVHQDYFIRMIRSFPVLTPADLRLVAFLKLGLSTKEIAVLTNRSKASIEVSRSRLRKKLNLSLSQNLTIYLSEF
jgi:DNA-binding CsgD family transcriptional regulator/membrane protein implicated in regulation of membrane protease activity